MEAHTRVYSWRRSEYTSIEAFFMIGGLMLEPLGILVITCYSTINLGFVPAFRFSRLTMREAFRLGWEIVPDVISISGSPFSFVEDEYGLI